MSESLASKVYVKGVRDFIKVAFKDMKNWQDNMITCPCQDCVSANYWEDVALIKNHLIERGFMKWLTFQINHGETPHVVVAVNHNNMPNPKGKNLVNCENRHCEMPELTGDDHGRDGEGEGDVDGDDDFLMPDSHQMTSDFEGKNVLGDYKALQTLFTDADTPSYAGCKQKISMLSTTL